MAADNHLDEIVFDSMSRTVYLPEMVSTRGHSHLTLQWAAVTTQFSLIREPPQKWKPV